MNEEIKTLLEELKLPEETVTGISTMLSEALNKARQEGLAEAEAAHDEEVQVLKEAANAYGQEIVANVQEYADYAAQEFINENREKLVQTEDYQRMQAAFATILEAFETNGFAVNKNAAVDQATEKLNERSKAFDTLFEETKTVKSALEDAQRKIIFLEQTRELTDTQIEATKELLEAVQFDSQEEYETGLGLILETVTRSEDNSGAGIDTGAAEVITEVKAGEEGGEVLNEKVVNPVVAKAVAFLGRMNSGNNK